MGRAAAAGLFLVATGVACATATVAPRVEPTGAHVADAGDAPSRDEAPRASAGDAAGAPGDPAIVLAAPGDAGGAGATDCVGQHWRIEVSESGEWSDPRETLCDDGSFASVVFSTRASAGRAPASVTHDAQSLLTEMRQRGQLRRRVPPTSHPFAREDCNAERPEECPAETIGVTFDGVEYFVDFGAKDPQDPGPRAALPGSAIAWPNQRAVRLLALLRGLAPALKVPRPGKVTVTGKLSSEVVRRFGRHNFGRFHLCYENARRTNPTLAGRVLVHFVIDPSGRSATASDGGSDLPDPGVVACVVNGFTDLSFPRPEEGTVNVVYEVVFAPAPSVYPAAPPAPSMPPPTADAEVAPESPRSFSEPEGGHGTFELRCGWVDNPTPANWSLEDRAGQWEIGVQGGYQAPGEMPDFGSSWVETNGHYGYGCACMSAVVDKANKRVLEYRHVRVLPLERCTKDARLPRR